MWLTHGEFVISQAMLRNQNEMADNYEEQIQNLYQYVESLLQTVETLKSRNAELERESAERARLAEKHRIDSSLYRSVTIHRHGDIQQLQARIGELETQNASLTKKATDFQERMMAYLVAASVNIARADAHQRQVACMVEHHPDSPLADASEGKAPLQEEFERTFVDRLKLLGPKPTDLQRLKSLRIDVRPIESMDLTTEDIESLGVRCRVPGSPPPQPVASGPTPGPR